MFQILKKLGKLLNFTSRENDDRYWGGGRTTSSGVSVNEETALTYSACWAATRLLAGSGGMLPLHLFQRREDNARTRNARHRVAKLLRNPNPSMRSMQFRALGINWQVNSGNFRNEIQRDNADRPFALWPIHPSRIKAYQLEEDAEVDGVQASEGDVVYRVQNNQGGPTWLHMRNVLDVPSIVTKNGIDGCGVITQAQESIGLGLAAERQGNRTFGDGGMPSVILTDMKFKSDEAKAQFRSDWGRLYGQQGERLAMLERTPGIHTLPFNAAESQFLESRQFNITDLARFYGVPPHLLGDLTRSTFSNIEQQALEYVIYALLPWLELWEQELDAKLLSEREQESLYTQHVVEGLLRGDSAARSTFYGEMIRAGIMTPNHAAVLENLEPYEGGDQHFMQAQMVPVDKLGMDEPEPTPATPETPQDQPDDAENGRLRRRMAKLRAKCKRLLRERDEAYDGWTKADTVISQVEEEANKAVLALQGEVASLRDDLRSTQSANRESVAEIVRLRSERGELVAAQSAMEERLTSRQDYIDDLKEQHVKDIAESDAQLATLRSQLESAAQSLESIQAQQESDGDKSSAEDVLALNSRIESLELAVVDEKRTASNAVAAMEQYKSKSQDAASENGALQAKVETLTADYSAASDMLTSLTEERDALQGQLRDSRQEAASAAERAESAQNLAAEGADIRKTAARDLAAAHIRLVFDRAIRSECSEVRRAAKHGTQSFKARIDDAYHRIRPQLLDELSGVAKHYHAIAGEAIHVASAAELHFKASRRELLDVLKASNDANLTANVRKAVEHWTERAVDSSAIAFTNGEKQ